MIVEVILIIRNSKNETTREKVYYFNIKDNGIFFTEDKINNPPLYILKTLRVDIIKFLDLLEEYEETISYIIKINGKVFKKYVENLDFIGIDISHINKFIKDLVDYKDPNVNLDITKNYHLSLWINKKVAETNKTPSKTKKKKEDLPTPYAQEEYIEKKICDMYFLVDTQEYLFVFDYEGKQMKFLTHDFTCYCFTRILKSFVEDYFKLKGNNDRNYYFYDEKENTKLWWQFHQCDEVLKEMLVSYIRAKHYEIPVNV
jgi:hypothetical protein